MTPPVMPTKSQFVSPARSCGHGELVPRGHSLPTGSTRSWSPAPSRFVEERPGAQTQSSWKPVPKCGWRLGVRKSAELCACLRTEQAGSHLAGADQAGLGAASQLAPALPQAKVGADSLEPSGPVSCAQPEFWLLVQPTPARHSGSADLGKPGQGSHFQVRKWGKSESRVGWP